MKWPLYWMRERFGKFNISVSYFKNLKFETPQRKSSHLKPTQQGRPLTHKLEHYNCQKEGHIIACCLKFDKGKTQTSV